MGEALGVSVEEIMTSGGPLGLTVIAGRAGLGNNVLVPRIQKPGLALSGWPEQLHERRLQVLGGTEVDYLEAIDTDARTLGIRTLMASSPAAVVVCRGRAAPAELAVACEEARVPLLGSTLTTADFIVAVSGWLGDRLAPQTQVHGVVVDVIGIGVLLLGKSGIGKSETALDLVVRGHRLVADDVVVMWKKGTAVIATGEEVIRHHLEIRGLGIINIKDLFGIAAVRETKKIELVVELVEWREGEEYDRLGIDDLRYSVLGIELPRLCLPVRPGRNLATLIEVAARNQLLKAQGHHSARELQERLRQAMMTRQRTDAVE
jgi:HPr kinase/phosphorylase